MKKEEELKDYIPDKQSIYTLIIVVCKYTYHIHRTICVLFHPMAVNLFLNHFQHNLQRI